MIDLLMNRRSLRHYMEKKVEEDDIKKIIQMALTAPSGHNLKPWEFVVVEDEETIKKLANSRGRDSKFMEDAPLGIAIAIDPEKSPTYLTDGSILAIYIQLAAQSLGIHSCWIQAHDRYADDGSSMETNIKNILNIPENYRILCLLSMGYSARERTPHKEEDLLYERVHFESFQGGLE